MGRDIKSSVAVVDHITSMGWIVCSANKGHPDETEALQEDCHNLLVSRVAGYSC